MSKGIVSKLLLTAVAVTSIYACGKLKGIDKCMTCVLKDNPDMNEVTVSGGSKIFKYSLTKKR